MRFLQTQFWAGFKSRHGWKSCPVTVGGNRFSILVRTLNFRFRKASIAYVPMAPECTGCTGKELEEKLYSLASSIRPQLPVNTFCIRFDPAMDFYTPDERDDFLKRYRSRKVRKAGTNIQPPDTTIVTLTGENGPRPEEELLSAMKSKWRYNIRLAAKKGVEVCRYDSSSADLEEAYDSFHVLFQQTSERDGVQFHNKEYYMDLLKSGSIRKESPDGNPSGTASSEDIRVNLYLARHEGDWLAGIITLFTPSEAVYLYGASGNLKRNLMAAYLLQWTAMKDAQTFGSRTYDFYGMPPTDDHNHPMHGLYLFKTGFGGQNTHRPGSFDVILNKGDYTLYSMAENARAFWYKVVIKKIKGR